MALLDHASNFNGPLPPEMKDEIMAYIDHPTYEAWQRLRNFIICPGSLSHATLWQAVTAIDKTFPTRLLPGDRAFPDGFKLARAIRHMLATRGGPPKQPPKAG